jgi:hypothetical protein
MLLLRSSLMSSAACPATPNASNNPRARIAEWVRQASEGQGGARDGSSDESFQEEAGHRGHGRSPLRGAKGAKSGRDWHPDDATPRHPRHGPGHVRGDNDSDCEAKDAAPASEHSSETPSGNDGRLLLASGPSLGDASSQQSGSEALDNGSSAAGDGGVDDCELVADFRLALCVGAAGDALAMSRPLCIRQTMLPRPALPPPGCAELDIAKKTSTPPKGAPSG